MGEDFHQLHPARGLIFKIFRELKRLDIKKLFYYRFIHKGQKLETTYMSIKRKMDKENATHLYNVILLSC